MIQATRSNEVLTIAAKVGKFTVSVGQNRINCMEGTGKTLQLRCECKILHLQVRYIEYIWLRLWQGRISNGPQRKAQNWKTPATTALDRKLAISFWPKTTKNWQKHSRNGDEEIHNYIPKRLCQEIWKAEKSKKQIGSSWERGLTESGRSSFASYYTNR